MLFGKHGQRVPRADFQKRDSIHLKNGSDALCEHDTLTQVSGPVIRTDSLLVRDPIPGNVGNEGDHGWLKF